MLEKLPQNKIDSLSDEEHDLIQMKTNGKGKYFRKKFLSTVKNSIVSSSASSTSQVDHALRCDMFQQTTQSKPSFEYYTTEFKFTSLPKGHIYNLLLLKI